MRNPWSELQLSRPDPHQLYPRLAHVKRTYRQLTSNTTDTVHHGINHLLANGVVATSIVVGSVFLAADQVLGVEQRAVLSGADLVDWPGVEIDEKGAGNMLATAGFGEEGLEGACFTDVSGTGVGATVRAEAVLEEVAVKRP